MAKQRYWYIDKHRIGIVENGTNAVTKETVTSGYSSISETLTDGLRIYAIRIPDALGTNLTKTNENALMEIPDVLPFRPLLTIHEVGELLLFCGVGKIPFFPHLDAPVALHVRLSRQHEHFDGLGGIDLLCEAGRWREQADETKEGEDLAGSHDEEATILRRGRGEIAE